MALYTDHQRKQVVARAIEAGSARGAHGMARLVAGIGKAKQVFDLTERVFCNRFVRQTFETALGMVPMRWYFGAAKACQTLDKLEPYRVPLKDRRPGDILGFAGDPGHIVIYLGARPTRRRNWWLRIQAAGSVAGR